ncbi:MATE family efflux transporter [Fusobacterium sp.]|uniref:MATE family efflux transporter n=1 Tax=Fusobacterium sp. TaxID=68766 RepID=UPI00263769B9|nr:MATE family efflux transporter [Fusobacterium sp.]
MIFRGGIKIKKKSFLSLAFPIFLELLLVNVVGNVDTYMLGKFSDEAVGAVGGISQVLLIQNSIFGFICLGTSILTAQFIGAKKNIKIKEVIATSLLMNLIFGLLIGAGYIIFSEMIMKGIHLPENLMDIGRTYFKLVGGLCVFQALTLTCGAVMKSFGNTKQNLFINVGVNILNVIGNGMFIFGWFGAPILGTTGVGISTVFSRFIGCIVAIFIMKKYCKFKFDIRLYKPIRIKIIKNILGIGIPTAGENVAWNVGQLLIMSMVNSMGMASITARTYLMLISTLIMTFSIAAGHGSAILVGQHVGAHEYKEAYDTAIKSLKISLILVGAISLIITIFKVPVMKFFTVNPQVLEVAIKTFRCILLLELGRTFNIVIINSLHAAGDIKFPMIAGVGSIFFVAVFLSWLLGIKLGYGLLGVWIANAADEWARGLIMMWRWKSKKWQNKSFI